MFKRLVMIQGQVEKEHGIMGKLILLSQGLTTNAVKKLLSRILADDLKEYGYNVLEQILM